jgi:hypothetical protein
MQVKLLDHSADRLATRTGLLMTADPGDALLAAAQLYDPKVRRWHGRLLFSNGVLLFWADRGDARNRAAGRRQHQCDLTRASAPPTLRPTSAARSAPPRSRWPVSPAELRST